MRYRLYTLDAANRVNGACDLDASNDDEAVCQARYRDDQQIEIWQGARRLFPPPQRRVALH